MEQEKEKKEDKKIVIPKWRNLASQIWAPPSDPTIYGFIEIDTTDLKSYIERKRKETGEKITFTTVVGKAIGDTLGELPELNLIMKRGRLVPRDSVDIFFQVEFGGGQLAGAKIKDVDKKSISEVARELREKAKEIKEGKEKKMTNMIKLFGTLPPPLIKLILRISRFISYELGIGIGGLDPDPFGSAMVTNVGVFGIEIGFAPLFPLSRTPIVVTVGAERQKPFIVGEEIKVRPVITIGAAIDHRYYDGYHAGILTKKFLERLKEFK